MTAVNIALAILKTELSDIAYGDSDHFASLHSLCHYTVDASDSLTTMAL